ncbi:hypothetical protein GJ744_004422 [Endocarpon pusillum]|uniref:CENP-V/GFA domain-containing protein n=1 Tax=Endocarpon pusillum TaxID=364733 RepID=A0A8H7ATK5_9EURO|nr:hypothetical protein GJ744_004422 [Endocarpon pusillum]
MFWHGHHPKEYVAVVPGLLENPDSILDISSHIFVGDTVDGGFSDWLVSFEGRPLPRWEAREETSKVLALGWHGSQGQDVSQDVGQDTLRAHCKCGGVDFLIKRPREREEADKPLDAKDWWVRSKNRYLAGNCACDSCRLTSGLEIVQWAYVPTPRLATASGEPYQFNCSTLKSFKSSENVTRYHCGRCGATVFFWRDSRPEVIDVAVGLLEAPSGARAEDWLDWRLKISHEEDATHARLLKAFKEGFEDWGKRNGKTYR